MGKAPYKKSAASGSVESLTIHLKFDWFANSTVRFVFLMFGVMFARSTVYLNWEVLNLTYLKNFRVCKEKYSKNF